jgi:alpha-L-fucosidase
MTGLGLMFHIGLYSVPAFDEVISARTRTIMNGAEWYLKRLNEKGTFRPTSGFKATQEFHKTHYPGKTYFDFEKEFNEKSKLINFDEWMILAKEIGANYVMITTKHHDGFTLWPSSTSVHHSEIDLLSLFVASARKYQLRVGFYYSWTEFDINPTKAYINDIMIPQINELIRYMPDIWFFDGDWTMKSLFSQNAIEQIVTYLRLINPNVEINDRLATKSEKLSTYRVFSDRYIPMEKPTVKWTHVNTVGLSWSINKYQCPEDYKSGIELMNLYKRVISLGGNFLINGAPDCNGIIDPREKEALLEFGRLRKEESKEQ